MKAFDEISMYNLFMQAIILISIIGIIFVGSIVAYAVVAIFWPEWVGITGKTALENEQSHREGSIGLENDVISRITTSQDTSKPNVKG